MPEKIKITKRDLISEFVDWMGGVAPRYPANFVGCFEDEFESSDLTEEDFWTNKFMAILPKSWVSWFFEWNTSKEGYNYWFAVDTLWREEIEKYEVEGESKELEKYEVEVEGESK